MSEFSAALEVVIEFVEALQAVGAEGIIRADWFKQRGYTCNDHNTGYIAHKLRKNGYLIQGELDRLFILPEAEIKKGAWVRHSKLGVVMVTFARDGFDCVMVAPLGQVFGKSKVRIKVRRDELSGK
jgi:hypothetical protein